MAVSTIEGRVPVVKQFTKSISTESNYYQGTIDVTASGLKPVAVVGFSHSNSGIYFFKLRVNNNSVEYGIAHRTGAAITTDMTLSVSYI